jgi:predicted ATPase
MHAVLNPEQAANAMQGIYLHGNVGSGKSMLMDLFLGAVSEADSVPRVRRMHFNDAMDELNRRMYRLQREREQLDARQNEAFLQSVAAHEHQNLVKSPTIFFWC